MTGLAWAALSLVGMFLFAALGDLASEEIRGWLDLAPRAVLRLAASQLDPAHRETIYRDEWLPELIYVLRGAQSRPITRLIRGTTFALGLFVSARKISRDLARTRWGGSLAKAAASGDAAAWRALVDGYSGLVWSITRSYGLNSADAADVFQTVWLRLAEHLGRGHNPDHIGAWLTTTARHESLRTRRFPDLRP